MKPGLINLVASYCAYCRRYKNVWHRLVAWLGGRVSHGCCAKCAQENFGID